MNHKLPVLTRKLRESPPGESQLDQCQHGKPSARLFQGSRCQLTYLSVVAHSKALSACWKGADHNDGYYAFRGFKDQLLLVG